MTLQDDITTVSLLMGTKQPLIVSQPRTDTSPYICTHSLH